MNWEQHVADLQAGKIIQIRPKGNSMEPKISSGNLVTLKPVKVKDPRDLVAKKDDIVFCKVKGHYYIHLVQAVSQKMGGCRYQIGNNKNHTNGWIGPNSIFGKVTKVEP